MIGGLALCRPAPFRGTTDLVRGLRLQFGEYLLRLRLGCERHG